MGPVSPYNLFCVNLVLPLLFEEFHNAEVLELADRHVCGGDSTLTLLFNSLPKKSY
jgi:hypothetical protein